MRLDRVAEVERAVLSEGSSAAVLIGGARERGPRERPSRERPARERPERERHSDGLSDRHPGRHTQTHSERATRSHQWPWAHLYKRHPILLIVLQCKRTVRPFVDRQFPHGLLMREAIRCHQWASEALRAAPPRAPCTCLSVPLAASPARRSKHSRRRPRQSSWLATR